MPGSPLTTNALGPLQPVTELLLERPLVSILTTVQVTELAEMSLGSGIDILQETQPAGGMVPIDCAPSGTNPKVPSKLFGARRFMGLDLYAGMERSTFGAIGHSMQARASTYVDEYGFRRQDIELSDPVYPLYDKSKRNLEIVEARLIETDLWDGSVSGNYALCDAAATPMTTPAQALPAIEALALVEDISSDYGKGTRLVIHCRPYTLSKWITARLAHPVMHDDGTFHFETYMGTYIVAGRGYTGSGPGNVPATPDNEWMYVTSPVTIGLGPIKATSPVFKENVSVKTNEVTVWAERYSLAHFNPAICHLAAQLKRG